MASEPSAERGLRWWLRYVVVPIIVAIVGGGGIAGIVIQFTSNNPPRPAVTLTPTIVLPVASPTLTPTKVPAEQTPTGVMPSIQVTPEAQPVPTPTVETATGPSKLPAEGSGTEQTNLAPSPTAVPIQTPATADPLFAIEIGDIVADGLPEPGAGNIETPGVTKRYEINVEPGTAVYFDEQGGDCSTPINWAL